MGSIYSAVCRDCGHEYELLRGPLFTSNEYVCLSCGDSFRCPHQAPTDSKEMDERALLRYAYDGEYAFEGRPFSERERGILQRHVMRCGCGGNRVEDIDDGKTPRRCPRCKSKKLDLSVSAMVD